METVLNSTHIGEQLRKVRELRGFSLTELSERSGLSINTIRRIEESGNAQFFNIYVLALSLGKSITLEDMK